MFKVAVINKNDLIKYFILLILIIIVVLSLTKYFNNLKKMDSEVYANEETEKITLNEGFFDFDFTKCFIETASVFKNVNNIIETENDKESNIYEDILKSQLGLIESSENKNIQSEDNADDKKLDLQEKNQITDEENNEISLAKTGLKTEVITQNPLKLNYNAEYGNVKIKNDTSFELTNDIMKPDIAIQNKNILLFHTHTCESYTSSEKFTYTPTGNFRTTDLNFSVARVGDELENHLKQFGYNIIHNKTYHDYPSYNGSYTHSLATVENILKQTPTDIIFDIHRDAVGSRPDYAPCVKIGDDVSAQIMFVIGTNEGGLWHPNWQQNLKFAIKVQQKAEELYPGLFKPIMLTKYRYNQHTGKYASIIEVGATGNTLEQCNNSMKYFSKVIDEVLK